MTFDVTTDEANLIGEGLGLLPFAKVATLMAKLQQQATKQLAPPPPTAPEPEVKPPEE